MSTENQNRENQNEKVDYQDLFNSLVKENEQKEPMAEKAKSKMKRKQKSQEKHQPSASQSQPELIGIEILTYFNVPAIVTVEWCFHPDIFACFSKNIFYHLRCFLALPGWWQLIKIINLLFACLSVLFKPI